MWSCASDPNASIFLRVKPPDEVTVAEVLAVVARKLLAVCLLVGPIFPGWLVLNHSNDAAFDLGWSTLCIDADREHKLATGCYDQNIAKFL